MQNTINTKLQAARELGLTVEQEYKTIDAAFFMIFNIKKESLLINSYLIPVDKAQTLDQLQLEKTALQDRIKKIDADIELINSID